METALAELVPELEPIAAQKGWSPRWLAVRLLEGDALARASVDEPLARRAQALAERFGGELDILVADARYSLANDIVHHTVHVAGQAPADLTERIDRVVLNRALGIPIFLVAMYLMFLFTIRVGGAFIDFFDQLAGAIFVDGFAEALNAIEAHATSDHSEAATTPALTQQHELIREADEYGDLFAHAAATAATTAQRSQA